MFSKKLYFSPSVWSFFPPVETMWLSVFDMQSPKELPAPVLALPHTEKEREGRKVGSFDERTEPSPPLALFPSLFPVFALWSLSGKEEAASANLHKLQLFFLCCVFSFARPDCVFTPIHLSVLLYASLPLLVCACMLFCMHKAVQYDPVQ